MNTLVPLRQAGDDFERALLEAGGREAPLARTRQRVMLALGAGMSAALGTGALSAAVTPALKVTGAAGPTLTMIAKWVGVGVVAGLAVAGTSRSLMRQPPTAAQAVLLVTSSPSPPPVRSAKPELDIAPPETPPSPVYDRPASSARPAGIAEELALLEAARAALAAGDSEKSAALLREHGRLATPAMGPEAELLRIEVALARGDSAGAATQARAFLAAHPRSPLTQRARSLLAAAEHRTVIESPASGNQVAEDKP
jgi:hypothetical protein